jgi:23S rRNA pseudouridine1911/1915/1917 synthase
MPKPKSVKAKSAAAVLPDEFQGDPVAPSEGQMPPEEAEFDELVLDDVDGANDDGDDEGDSGAGSAAYVPEAVDVTVDAAHHLKRLDQFLALEVPHYSRNHLKQLIEDGLVTVGGQPQTSPSKKVQAGQRVQAQLRPTAQSLSFTPEAMALNVVYEDDDLLVVNKPVGLVVHPAAGNWSGTLLNGLLAHHAGAVVLPRAGIVHRLDKDTSGLMVVGKTLEACTRLTRAIADRKVHRQYRALVWGDPPIQFSIDAPIGRDPVSRVKMAVVRTGKPARTDVKVRGVLSVDHRFRTPKGVVRGEVAAVECTLHTGRTHQIRVHLSNRQYPLVADALYGGPQALGMERQALHAFRLSFEHPITGEKLVFRAAMPEDLSTAWQQVVHNEPEDEAFDDFDDEDFDDEFEDDWE